MIRFEERRPDNLDISSKTAGTVTSYTVPSTDSEPIHITSSTLPSTTENQRSQSSKRLSRVMDALLARASIASQHINEYTGTDYTGIDALRKEIARQEEIVRSCINATVEAKSHHHQTHSHQTSAQREIVALLERKSSWSPSDLERYMALVRSEHLNEQAVQTAKEDLATRERDLDEARAQLERLERKRYHEEQVWSDTIRRNSTWVTFGLMGVNIVLLLAQILVFEPMRRKRIVRDVKAALDEKTFAATPEQAALATPSTTPIGSDQEREEKSTDAIEQLLSPTPETTATKDIALADPPTISAASLAKPASPSDWKEAAAEKLKASQAVVLDQFSDRVIQLRKVDVTTTAAVGALTGAFVTGLVAVLITGRAA